MADESEKKIEERTISQQI